MNRPQDSFDRDVDEIGPANLDSDSEGLHSPIDEEFNAETLIVVYCSIAKSWYKESLVARRVYSYLVF
jgi:hypothetical protein